jgi:hypothetical protein
MRTASPFFLGLSDEVLDHGIAADTIGARYEGNFWLWERHLGWSGRYLCSETAEGSVWTM